MEDEKRDFKGVWIPKEIWLDERLNALDKCIFVEVDSLDNEETGCYASNKYLADFCKCSETKVSTALSKLINLGYLYVQSFDGRQRILKSRLSKIERQPFKICKADFQNLQDNTIYNNIVDKKENIIKEIIDYLNSRLGTRYAASNKKTQSLIKARLAENKEYTGADFKEVIDKKVKEWKGTEMEKYLRPETLFGTKFESYLNQKEVVAKQTKYAFDYMQREYSEKELAAIFTNSTNFDGSDIE